MRRRYLGVASAVLALLTSACAGFSISISTTARLVSVSTCAGLIDSAMSCCCSQGPWTTRVPVPQSPKPGATSMQSGPLAGAM